MTWQYETGVGTDRATTYQDMLVKIVAFATSQKVATVAVNAAGTGWTTGDIATLTHAGAYLDAKFEVTASAGAITALRIVANGAFGNRLASAAVSAGGTNYAVGNVLEVQGGSAREKGKVTVATISGSAVLTVTLFETGGAYSSTPANPAATTKIGPNAGTGSGCTLTVTYTGLVGVSALAVTGAGSSATVNITLAETGWSVDNRNTNSTSTNGITNEKEVVLKGDAAGRTNKPYIGFVTFTKTSGVNIRYIIGIHPMIAHNQATALSVQPGILGTVGTWGDDDTPYILCDENQLQQMDFWLSVNDRRICGVLDINSGAATSDDRQFMQFYAGFLNSFATEVEDPYSMFAFGARAANIDPSASTFSITGLNECIAPTGLNTGIFFYRTEDSTWQYVYNSRNLASSEQVNIIAPMGNIKEPTFGITSSISSPADVVAFDGPIVIHTGIGSLARASATRRLFPIPGTTPKHYPFPLTLVSRNTTNNVSLTLDFLRGNLDGCYMIYNTDSAGTTIANFALDYITVGADRYRVFHNHVQRELYQYICIKEDGA